MVASILRDSLEVGFTPKSKPPYEELSYEVGLLFSNNRAFSYKVKSFSAETAA